MTALVLAEHDNKNLAEVTLKTVTAAQFIGTVDILVVGYQCQQVAVEAAKIAKINKVLLLDHIVYEHQLAENITQVIAMMSEQYTHVFAPASTFGKNIMPGVAALLDVMQISDIVHIDKEDIFVRPIYAGNALMTVQSHDPKKIITVRTAAFNKASISEIKAPIETLTFVFENSLSKFIGQELTQTTRPELTSARVIISGGRGLGNRENFKLLESIADPLNAAIGASRAAVDAGFVSNDYQVGQTGKIVAPDLYIAVGISGAIQHVAGMSGAKVIVAINKDPDAPIFKIADYGIVGDLFQILPEFAAELEKIG